MVIASEKIVVFSLFQPIGGGLSSSRQCDFFSSSFSSGPLLIGHHITGTVQLVRDKSNKTLRVVFILQQNFHRFPHSLHRTNVVIGSSADLERRQGWMKWPEVDNIVQDRVEGWIKIQANFITDCRREVLLWVWHITNHKPLSPQLIRGAIFPKWRLVCCSLFLHQSLQLW